jgi:hypothetical protein
MQCNFINVCNDSFVVGLAIDYMVSTHDIIYFLVNI